jgi:hypothetical protein
MYEYDLYMDARKAIPRIKEPLQAIDGEYFLVKTDILAKTMTFSSSKETMSNVVTIPVWRVREILAANRNGEKVESIVGDSAPANSDEPTYRTEEDSITRFDKSKKRKKKRNNKSQSRADRAEGASKAADSSVAEPKSEPQAVSAQLSEPQSEPKDQSVAQGEGENNGQTTERRPFNRGRNNRFRHNRRPNQGGKGEAGQKPEKKE